MDERAGLVDGEDALGGEPEQGVGKAQAKANTRAGTPS